MSDIRTWEVITTIRDEHGNLHQIHNDEFEDVSRSEVMEIAGANADEYADELNIEGARVGVKVFGYELDPVECRDFEAEVIEI